MRTFIHIKLDTRRAKKDGTFPIIFRLTHFRRTTSISTGMSLIKTAWDFDKGLIKRDFLATQNHYELNTILLKKFTEASSVIHKLWDSGKLNHLSIRQIKDLIIGQNKYTSFFAFGELCIEELKHELRYGSARNYGVLLSRLRSFNNGRDLRLNEINYAFLKNFEKEHFKKGNSLNGLASYMRTLRAIMNKAIKAGHLEKEAYPFERYTIKTKPTPKRALEIEDLKKLITIEFKKGSALFNYRNYFLLSFMLYGLSFMDLAYLKVSDINNNRLKFCRRKTGKLYDIKITEQISQILDYYLKGKESFDYILPILKRQDLELQYKDYEWERGRYNKGLKLIGEKAGIKQSLTSYVSRHSFATQALFQNVPIAAISEMMGHSKISTTQIYLKSLPNKVLDNYNEELNKVINSIVFD